MPIEKIITLAPDPSIMPQLVHQTAPSWLLNLFQWAGIPVVSIDGQLLPQTMILVMFAAWGVWHWILMAQNAVGAIAYHWSKRNAQTKEDKDED